MKIPFKDLLSKTLWNYASKVLKERTHLKALQLKDDSIQIEWQISNLDKIRAKSSNSYFFGVRVFDVSISGSKATSTCIMKEFQISKYNQSCRLSFPSLSSKYYIEIGYRKTNGEWRELRSIYLNSRHHIKQPLNFLVDEDWFYQHKDSKIKINDDLHNKIEGLGTQPGNRWISYGAGFKWKQYSSNNLKLSLVGSIG